jgi:hypothetical protein
MKQLGHTLKYDPVFAWMCTETPHKFLRPSGTPSSGCADFPGTILEPVIRRTPQMLYCRDINPVPLEYEADRVPQPVCKFWGGDTDCARREMNHDSSEVYPVYSLY